MVESRIKSNLERSASGALESGRRSERSAMGAFIMLLVASGIAAVSFFLASPDGAFSSGTAMPPVRAMPR